MTPEEIRALRECLNLSQTELGVLLGIKRPQSAQNSVSRWEVGKNKPYPAYEAALQWLANNNEADFPEGLTQRLAMVRVGIDPDSK